MEKEKLQDLRISRSLTSLNLGLLKHVDNNTRYLVFLLLSPAIIDVDGKGIMEFDELKRRLLIEFPEIVITDTLLIGKFGKSLTSLISLEYNTVKNVRQPLRPCVNPESLIILRRRDNKCLREAIMGV